MIDLKTHGKLPNTLTILHTYKCTAACDHCCFESSPSVEGRIPQPRLLKYIYDASELGVKAVVFSGGEAFLLGKDLDEAIRLAHSLGLGTRVVTNGYWATTSSASLMRLSQLQQSGLDEISFSTGDFHQKFVPFDRIINGLEAAVTLRLTAALMIESRTNRQFTEDVFLASPRMKAIMEDPTARRLISIIESPWMPFKGEAELVSLSDQLVNRTNVHGRKRCGSILSTIIVDPYENMGACCGLTRAEIPELNLGSLKNSSMQALFSDALNDFLKIWIFVEGPERILAWAAEKNPSIDWENKYAHICHSCRALYNDPKVAEVICEHYHERFADVYFRYWMLTEFETKDRDDLTSCAISN